MVLRALLGYYVGPVAQCHWTYPFLTNLRGIKSAMPRPATGYYLFFIYLFKAELLEKNMHLAFSLL